MYYLKRINNLKGEILVSKIFKNKANCSRKSNKNTSRFLSTRQMDRDEIFSACLESEKVLKLVDVFEGNQRIHVYENFTGGTLADYIKMHIESDSSIPLENTYVIMQQLIEVLDFFNQNGIIFNNLKPENVVFTEEGNLLSLKVFNFEAAFWNDTDLLLNRNGYYYDTNIFRVRSIGNLIKNTWQNEIAIDSVNYASPELLLKKDYSNKSDIWSLGLIFYILLTCSHPYEYLQQNNEWKDIKDAILYKFSNSNSEDLIPNWDVHLQDFPKEIRSLLFKMLKINPNKRVWITEKFNIIYTLSKLLDSKSWDEINSSFQKGYQSDWIETQTTIDSSRIETKSILSIRSSASNISNKIKIYSKYGVKWASKEDLNELSLIFSDLDYKWKGRVSRENLELTFQVYMDTNKNFSQSDYNLFMNIVVVIKI